MSETDSMPPEVASAAPESVVDAQPIGGQLRAAREAAHLSVDEVASALKFSPRQIEALEADDFASLPGSTIVRGFIRNYARFLKVDPEGLLRQLEAVMPSVPLDVRPPDNMGIASQPRGLREFSPVVTVAIVLLLATSLLVLWHFFGPTQSVTTTMTSAQPGPVEPAPVQEPALPATPAVTPPAPASLTPAGENVMPPPAGLPAEAAVPSLRFEFAERAWVEVTDASRQLLHSGENPSGTQLVVTGKPPFEIVIGNASKVKLTYGDKAVELAPYMRAEVARLTLE